MGPPYPRVLSFSLVRKSSIQMPDTTQDQSHLTRSGLFHPKWIIGMNFQRLLPTLDSRVRVPRSFRPPWRCLRHHLRFWLGVMVNMLALDVFLLLRWWSLCWLDSYMNLTFDRLLFMWMTERLVQMKCYGLNYGGGSAKMLTNLLYMIVLRWTWKFWYTHTSLSMFLIKLGLQLWITIKRLQWVMSNLHLSIDSTHAVED